MSVSTNLFLNHTVQLSELKEAFEHRYGNVKVHLNESMPYYQAWTFKCPSDKKHVRQLSVHLNYSTAGFSGTLITLGNNDEAIRIMEYIGSIFGGFLTENDCDGNIRNISGRLEPSNGMPYFVRYAIIHDGVDPKDLTAISKSIKKWESEVCKSGLKGEIK